jgi:hypothetical protein
MKSLLLTGSMLAMIGTAQAADFTIKRMAQTMQTHVYITGEILFDDNVRFIRHLPNNKPDYIVLESSVGNLEAGLEIGRIVRNLDLKTVVFANRRCSSACSMVWLAGVVRWLSPNAFIGFHAASDGNGNITSDGNAVVGSYLGKLGFNDAFIRYATSAPPDSMQWLSEEDAKRYGVTVFTLKK